MKKLLHIPHSSLIVPDRFYEGLLISKEDFARYNLEMSDIGVCELFSHIEGERIIAPCSRLYCDLERFKDDSKEPMAKYGEGVIYTHTYDGKLFHRHDKVYVDEVMKYYDNYHQKFDEMALKLLNEEGELLILDCHSFSDKMASHFFKPPFPDICIGIEKDYFDEKILDKILLEIKNKGYSYKINYPYSGSIIPNVLMHNKVDGKVVTIMIEVNKRIYL